MPALTFDAAKKRGVHKVRHAIFDQFYPHPLSHFVTHPGTPRKVRHTSRTPRIFSRPSRKNPDKRAMYKFSLNCSQGFCPGGLSGGLLSGRFCAGWFLSIPPSATISFVTRES